MGFPGNRPIGLMTPTGRLASVGACFGNPTASKFCGCSLRARVRGFEWLEHLRRRLRMTGVWALASLWLGLALIASLFAIWFRISTALSEIVVGTVAQLIIGAAIGSAVWAPTILGQVSLRNRRDRPDVPCGRRTRSCGLQIQVERGRRRWAGELLFPVPGLRGGRPLFAGMGGDAQLARRCRDVDHFGRRRLCRDDRVRLQHHRVRQDRTGGLFRHRSRDRGRTRPHLRALHGQDLRLPRSWRGGLRGSTLAHASLLSNVWRPTF